MSDNSDVPKPTVSAHFDEPSMQDKPVPAEQIAEYLLSMLREEPAEDIIRQLNAKGLVVDEVCATLVGALASFLATVYAEDEQRACNAYGHLQVFGHALMHELIAATNDAADEAAEAKDAEDLSDS